MRNFDVQFSFYKVERYYNTLRVDISIGRGFNKDNSRSKLLPEACYCIHILLKAILYRVKCPCVPELREHRFLRVEFMVESWLSV